MTNYTAMDYLRFRGNLSFKVSPFNEVDNLILSLISYINFDNYYKKNISLKELIENYFANNKIRNNMLGLILSNKIISLAKKVKDCERFNNLKVVEFVNKIDKDSTSQFALLALRDSKNLYVVYRGTDDSVDGWIEDAMLTYKEDLVFERLGVKYLEKLISKYKTKKVYLMGHSKGGHLALYCALKVDSKYQDNIVKVYNNDGPGISFNLLKSFDPSIASKIINILPSNSFFGVFFTKIGDVKIVKSLSKGLSQHDGLTWVVDGDVFLNLESLQDNSTTCINSIETLISKNTYEFNDEVIQVLIKLFKDSNINYLIDLKTKKLRFLINYRRIERKYRRYFERLLILLIRYKFIARPYKEK